MSDKKTELAETKKPVLSQSERFALAVQKEAANNAGIKLTEFQLKLAQNYFVRFDQQLKDLHLKQLGMDEKYRQPFEYDWKNINITGMALGVVAMASMELDPSLPNHVSMVCIPNKHTKKYDVAFWRGYKGLEIIAKKFALDPPDHAIVELVYKNDKFKIIKKDMGNPVENYSFEIIEPFDRGELVGLFYYLVYPDPTKNKCVSMNKKEIDKHKPAKAAAEFWGGEKEIKKWDKKENKMMPTGEKEIVEGWYDKMAYKTGVKQAWSSVTLDSSKINANFLLMSKIEKESVDLAAKEEIAANANQTTVDITHEEITQEPQRLEKKNEDDKLEADDKEQTEINFNS